MSAVLEYLPKGNTLSDDAWQRRHQLLQAVLAGHLPALLMFGLWRGVGLAVTAESLALPLGCLILGRMLRGRRPASLLVTAGLIYCSAALVGFSGGAIEAHFHFFIMIGFIALYQDWVPFLLDILFVVLSHGIGSTLVPDLMFDHPAAQNNPWTWSLIHGVAVLAACVGVVLFWKNTEDEQSSSLRSIAELDRRRFTADLLVNLARRNQNLLYRQLELLNQLEDKERDPDALADLFRLDHLATRIRRNAESLLVLSGEESPRTWRGPVQLADVVRAAIAQIEDLDRVDQAVDETLAVSGRTVADLTHLLAELLENAVHFSPPGVTVMVRTRPVPQSPGSQVVTVEDWGVGMTPHELAEANDILRVPRKVDLSVSQRLGLHVVARLAHQHRISVGLTATPGGGVTAAAVLPAELFERAGAEFAPAGAPTPLDAPARASWAPPAGAPARAGAGPRGSAGVVTAGSPAPSRIGAGSPSLAGPRAQVPPTASEAPRGLPMLPSRPANPTGPGIPTGRPVPGRTGAQGDRLPAPGGERPGAQGDRPPAAGSGRTGALAERASGPGSQRRGTQGDRAPSPGSGMRRDAGGPAGAGSPTDRRSPTRPTLPTHAGSLTDREDRTDRADRTDLVDRAAGRPQASPPAPPDAGPVPLPRRPPGATLATTSSPTGSAGRSDGWSSWWTRETAAGPVAAPTVHTGPSVVHTGPSVVHTGPQAEHTGPQVVQAGPSTLHSGPQATPAPGPTHPDPNGSTPPPEPYPLPEPRPPADDQPRLSRRVPQASLAAGLRRETADEEHEQEPAAVRDPLTARTALSRFQAAQRAARESVEGTDGGPPR